MLGTHPLVELIHCRKLLIVLTTKCRLAREIVVMRGSVFVLETNFIRQPERQLPSSSYNHNTLTTLRTSVKDSPACIKSMKVPHCNFEVHL